jgi:hypothetical protein
MNDATTVIDNGNEAVTLNPVLQDARSIMLSSASDIAKIVADSEGKLADTAKTWGHNLFRAVYTDKVSSLDGLIGDSKTAAGWATLSLTDIGKKAKGRLEVYFSNARLVAEKWESLDQAERDAILAGTSSIHYVAGQFRKVAADALKEANKVAKAAKKAADDATAAQPDTSEGAPAPTAPVVVSFADMVANMVAAIGDATDDELTAAYDGFAAMIAAFDGRINAATAGEPLAEAA